MTWRAAMLFTIATSLCWAQVKPAPTDPALARGAQFMQEQLFEAAAKEFEQVLKQSPSDSRARFQYAVCLLQIGRNDDARAEFEEVLRQKGPSPYITYYLGRLDLLSNDYVSAIKRLGSIAENPPFPDTPFHLGAAYVSSGDNTEGVKWLERAARLQPRDYRVHYRLGRAYSSSGREQDATREYELYTRLRDEHKNTEKDVRDCVDSLRNHSSNASRDICRRIFDPNDADKLTLLGQLFGDAGAFGDALDPLKRAVQLDPKSFEAWHNLGVTYFRLERYEDARTPLETAVKLRPEFYGSVVLLGATLYMLGDDDAALPVLEHAHRLNPADAQTADVLEKLRAGRQKK